MRYAIASLMVFAGLASIARADPADQDMAFQKNLDLLHVQMKIKALSLLRDNDFFVPKTILKKYLEEQDRLCRELNGASALELSATVDWANEIATVKKAESDTMEKAAEDFGKKVLNSMTKGAGDKDAKDADKGIMVVLRDYNLKLNEWKRNRKRSALELARYVEEAAAALNAKGVAGDIPKEWRATANQIYRGCIKDTDKLVDGIVNLEKERIYYDGCLQAMKRVQDTLKVIEFLEDDKSAWESLAEKTRDQVASYLKEKYANGVKEDEEMIKFGVDKIYVVLKKSKAAWDKCGELDKDPILAENPTALVICKRMAAINALFDSALDIGKEMTFFAPIKPLFSVLEYYGKSMALVETFARTMQKFYNQVSQGYKGYEKLSTWGELMDKDLGPFWQTSLNKHYGFQIATGEDRFEGENLKFYMVVPKDVLARGYYQMNQQQYDRLAEAVAAERIITTRKEAAGSAGVWVTENLWNKSTDVATPPYIPAMKESARKSPYLAKGKEKDVLALAQGLPVTYNDKDVNADWFLTRLDTELDIIATELTVRAATSTKFSSDSIDRWEQFKQLIKSEKVALSPDQLLRLFTHSLAGGAQDDQVRKYLRVVANQRKWRKLGSARVGVPLVTSDSPDRIVQPFTTVNLTAHVIVSDLAPGREIEAEVTWMLPDWAGGAKKAQVKLKNGLTRLNMAMKAPVEIPRKPFEVKVTVRIPVGDGEEQAMEGSATFQPRTQGPAHEAPAFARTGGRMLPLWVMLVGQVGAPAPAPNPGQAKFREFSGSGKFSVEVVPFKISTTRCANYSMTGIDVTSDDLAALEFKLGEQNPTGLKYVLYRATSSEGPFDKPCGEITVFAGQGDKENFARPNPNPDAAQGRLGKNLVRLADMLPDQPGELRKPRFFQVSQQSVDWRGKVLSKELRSNTVGPSESALLVERGMSKDGALPANTGSPPGYYSFPVSLSVPNQAYDAYNAHFVVTSGGWTGHFWARPSPERNAIATVMVPTKLEGMSVSISAEGDGMSGSATFTIPTDPKTAGGARETAQRIMAEQERRAKAQATGKESYAAVVKRTENEAAARANGPKFLYLSYLKDKAIAELDLREFLEYHMPWAAADARADAAKLNGVGSSRVDLQACKLEYSIVSPK